MKQRERISRSHQKYHKRTQSSGFLNRYDFAYNGIDTVNQVGKIVPGLIKKAIKEINNVAPQRMNQIISQRWKEVETVLPKLLRGAIIDVYQTPFRQLGNFGKQQLNKIKKNIPLDIFKCKIIVCTDKSNIEL